MITATPTRPRTCQSCQGALDGAWKCPECLEPQFRATLLTECDACGQVRHDVYAGDVLFRRGQCDCTRSPEEIEARETARKEEEAAAERARLAADEERQRQLLLEQQLADHQPVAIGCWTASKQACRRDPEDAFPFCHACPRESR